MRASNGDNRKSITSDEEEASETNTSEEDEENDNIQPLLQRPAVSYHVRDSRGVEIGPRLSIDGPVTISNSSQQGGQHDIQEVLQQLPQTSVQVTGSSEVRVGSHVTCSSSVVLNRVVVLEDDCDTDNETAGHDDNRLAICESDRQVGTTDDNNATESFNSSEPPSSQQPQDTPTCAARTILKLHSWLRRQPYACAGLCLGTVSLIGLCVLWTVMKNTPTEKLVVVKRREWSAKSPASPPQPLAHPVRYVIILHTAVSPCATREVCVRNVLSVQRYHMEDFAWDDIGYNFLVGGDGHVYEGRGWDAVGAFVRGYNRISIGIAFIGTFSTVTPAPRQVEAGQRLINKGVRLGKISENYKLLAHLQVRRTDSPGAAFYRLIKNWPHWAEHP